MKIIKELIYLYGFKAGFILIALPIMKDIFFRGAREWNMVSIGTWGIIIQIIGIYLLYNGGRDAK
jgi:hypothetical protein